MICIYQEYYKMEDIVSQFPIIKSVKENYLQLSYAKPFFSRELY